MTPGLPRPLEACQLDSVAADSPAASPRSAGHCVGRSAGRDVAKLLKLADPSREPATVEFICQPKNARCSGRSRMTLPTAWREYANASKPASPTSVVPDYEALHISTWASKENASSPVSVIPDAVDHEQRRDDDACATPFVDWAALAAS